VTTDQALLKVGAVIAEAAAEVLRGYCGPEIAPGPPALAGEDADPLAELALPAVVARVTYAGAATGGTTIAMPIAAARRVAAAMMGADPPVDEAATLSEIEYSAFGEAVSEIMAAAGQAAAALLRIDIDPGTPETEIVTAPPRADEPAGDVHAVCVDLAFTDAPCRLVQLVPAAFAMQIARALDETLVEHDADSLKTALCDIPVRVWVEMGRASMPLGRLVALPPGEVVELDRDVDDPVDLYVDGMRVARGRLAVSDSGEFLTLQIESLVHADGALAARAASVPLASATAAA